MEQGMTTSLNIVTAEEVISVVVITVVLVHFYI